MAKSDKPDPTKVLSEQSKRFVEAARALQCDEDEQAFEKRLKEVATSPPPKPDKPKTKKKNPAK